jgi:glutaconate CoA-transferase subunit B
MEYSPTEMMIVAAARELRDGERVLVGVGQPNLAANLAKRVHAPGLQLIYEAGVIDADPSRLPLSIGDPCLVTGSVSVCSFFDLFAYYLQGGLVDVGFMGAAQIDRFGNLNSTVIGDYHRPKVRMAGSGGACDIACLARRLITLTPHQTRRFPERCDFVTSPGYISGRRDRDKLGLVGRGPEVVITDLGVLRFNEDGEMMLVSLFEGSDVDRVRQNTGWPLLINEPLGRVQPPIALELETLRSLDPGGIYLGKSE